MGRVELSEGKYWEIKVKRWKSWSIYIQGHGQPLSSLGQEKGPLAAMRTGVVRVG